MMPNAETLPGYQTPPTQNHHKEHCFDSQIKLLAPPKNENRTNSWADVVKMTNPPTPHKNTRLALTINTKQKNLFTLISLLEL